VKQNLLFYTLWTRVQEISLPSGTVLSGKPHNKLLGDDTEQGLEIVLPARIGEEVSPKRLNTIFNDMQQAQGTRPKRLIIGIVNDDSTVVYYFIHDGLVKPKKN
jgi:tRNA-splicing endonuclease subunit Sen15